MNNPMQQDFVITRRFRAPRELVFRAWSEAEHLAQWWGPKGFAMKTLTLDCRPGGVFHYGMSSANGQTMWGRFVFREIVPPERLVFVISFSDENGGITRAPFNPHWPLEVLNTATFAEDGDGTVLTLRGAPLNASAEEVAAYAGFHASMRQGFGGTFDQLDAHLAALAATAAESTALPAA